MLRSLIACLLLFSLTTFGNTNSLAGKRIVTLGVRNESNTFSTAHTKLSDFKVRRGDEVLQTETWDEVCAAAGVQVIPILHAYAWPGGVVEKKAFDQFMEEILAGIRKAGPIDGIYMDMHGALHAEGYADAQATLIKEIRKIVGNKVLISGSFDLHGNLSKDFVDNINILSAYRTAPHRDEVETRQRAVNMLLEAMDKQLKPVIETVTIPILVPGEKSITENEPLQSIYAQLPGLCMQEGIMDASIFAGYCWADLSRSAMRVFVVARSSAYQQQARKAANSLAQQIWNARAAMQLNVPSGSFPEMFIKALNDKATTVFISDSGDNTTAGAPGDNTQVLAHLLKQPTKQKVLLAGMVDPEAFKACMAKQKNDEITLTLGGRIDYKFSKPVSIKGKILFQSPQSEIEKKRGAVLLNIEGISVVILNDRRSFTQLADFKDIGLDPMDFKVVIVKLGYLFPELADIAPLSLMALTAGFCNLDIPNLPYKQVTRPAYPLDPDMVWKID
jgi:microcystin degradation protein MlrC